MDDDIRNRKKQGLVFKLDFEKAYDWDNWGFLDKVLIRKGFSSRWNWISWCLPSAPFVVSER